MAYVTQDYLRQALIKKIGSRTQISVCREIGVPPQNLSLMLKGAPVGGKVLAWLGYESVTRRLYQRKAVLNGK